jgi:hypothetical protein
MALADVSLALRPKTRTTSIERIATSTIGKPF